MSQEWAKFLKETRRLRGWSQGRLSEETAKYMPEGREPVSVGWISAMERNQAHPDSGANAHPSEDVAEAIGRALGVDVDEARLRAGFKRLNDEPIASGLGAVTVIIPATGDVTVVSGNGTALQAPREMFESAALNARGVLASNREARAKGDREDAASK